MNQTTASTHPASDLEALRLLLEEDRNAYYYNFEGAHEQLLHTLQTNDCREIITAVVDGDDLAHTFVVVGARGHVDILEAFLHHGMNVDIKNRHGWTALMEASCHKHEQSVRFLLDHNAKVDVQENFGYTALMLASQQGNSKIVEMLLEKNANTDLQRKNGTTALMWASANSRKELVEVLLSHNADIELKDDSGRTAFDFAKTEEIKELIRNHVSSTYVLK